MTAGGRIPIPIDSTLPQPPHDAASTVDYDVYFGLSRGHVTLQAWTEGCLSLEQELLSDLESSGLPESERLQMMMGMLILYRATLRQWIAPGNSSTDEACDR
ncbi:MAG TPA: hypothetical protein VGG98_06185 [Solirubrobacteraceae bacterium]|jgi:hypothetical protein